MYSAPPTALPSPARLPGWDPRILVPPEAGKGETDSLGLADMKACVRVTLKPGVLDPQGKAIGNALAALGFTGIGEVRQGKLIELDLAEIDPARAREQVERMCKALLVNPVIEDYAIELAPAA